MNSGWATVIAVVRGGCDAVVGDSILRLKLAGKHAHGEASLAVGDELTYDPEKLVIGQVLPRRTQLRRIRSFGKAREQVIAANIDRLAIVASVDEPPFRPGAVDRFLIAARAGGLEAILVVNKLDLLAGEPLPDEILAYTEVLPIFPVSARDGRGLAELRAHLVASRTVLAGHSGVGKSSLINAFEPELRLETGALGAKYGRGVHTTTGALWIRLADGAIVIDTPGVREIGTGPLDRALLNEAYPDLARRAEGCRFRDCAHDQEPGCAVRAAVESGELRAIRLASYRRLVEDSDP